MIQFDHIGMQAHDALEVARTLADLLGAPRPTPDGADDDLFRIDLAHGAFLLSQRQRTLLRSILRVVQQGPPDLVRPLVLGGVERDRRAEAAQGSAQEPLAPRPEAS
jgi:hypothetical protein